MHCLLTKRRSDIDMEELLICTDILLHCGFDINLSNNLGETPLYMAVKANYVDVVVTLLGAGAMVYCKTKTGRNVIHAACECGNVQLLQILVETKQVNE